MVPEDGSPQKVYWAWVSKAIEGDTLKNTIESRPEEFEAAIPSFSPLNIAEQFVFATVTGQEDGSLRNFIHAPVPTPGAGYGVWTVAKPLCAAPEKASGCEDGLPGKEYIVLKSVILLLRQPMGEPMDRAMAEKLMLLNPAEVIAC